MRRRIQLLTCIAAITHGCGQDTTGPSPTAPQIVSLGPNRARPNSDAFNLVVRGHHFQETSVVEWEGDARQTDFVDSTQLRAFIPGQDLAAAGTREVRVLNPNGERSLPVNFTVADDAIAFGVDSVLPPCCGDASAGVTVAVFFNEALDPESLGDSALRVLDGTTPVVGTVTYDVPTRSLRFSTPLPALRRYTVWVGDAVRSVSGGGLPNPFVWEFTTARGPLVAIEGGGFGSLVLGSNGRPRIAYRATDQLRLASCTGDCTRRSGWTTQTPDAAGGVGLYASLTVSTAGALFAAHQDFANDIAKVAAIGVGTTTIEGSNGAAFTSIAAGAASRLYVTYYDAITKDLRIAACTSACLSAGSWTITTIDTVGNVGAFSSVAVDAEGAVHVTYLQHDAGDLRYATCAAPCTTSAWSTTSIDTTGRVGIGSSLIVDGGGGLHVTYYDQTNGAVKYGACTADCTLGASWSTTIVTAVSEPIVDRGFYSPSVALGPGGELHTAFANHLTSRYEGASCAGGCTDSGSWTVEPLSLQGPAFFGGLMSLKVDAAGARHLTWTDANGILQYMRY